jgi:uncharacterized membrane protein
MASYRPIDQLANPPHGRCELEHWDAAVRDTGEAGWWRKTRLLAAGLTGGAGVLAVVILALAGDGAPVLDLPLGTLVATTILPLAILIATLVFAGRQRRLDRDYDVAED